jgi:LmbE family N-acetylglucosaminyl deacetylase
MQNIIVVSPHPDDEAIGCGGAISKHTSEGDIVEVVFLTSGEKGGHGRSEAETIRIREEEAEQAAKILHVSNIEFWRQPDGNLQASPENVERLKKKIVGSNADIIYVPHKDEAHPDHQAAATLVRKTIPLLPENMEKPKVWMYEVWTPLQKFDLIIDISAYVEIKRNAILAHKSQCSVMSFDEAILGLNRYRGEMYSWPDGEYAETFIACE